jgi:hypothetical protein
VQLNYSYLDINQRSNRSTFYPNWSEDRAFGVKFAKKCRGVSFAFCKFYDKEVKHSK